MLGDEAESLRLARHQLDELIREVDEEAGEAERRGRGRPGDPNGPASAAADRPRQTDTPSRPEAERLTGPGTDRPQQAGEPERPGGTPREGASADGARSQGDDRRTARANAEGRAEPSGRGGGRVAPERWDDTETRRPMTGEDYLQWSDRLRDVEEMLDERDLREEAARVRDRARAMRAEFVRHGTEPQWDLVRHEITDPLTELRQHISDKLARLQSDDARVPIDRDPVPDRYAELVRRYFENLGGDE